MAALDTNVLVRHLVHDDAPQVAAARALFEQAATQGNVLFVALTVALELEWVLRSRYRLDKTEILRAFAALLESRELQFQAEPVLEQALDLYQAHNADFAECMHLAACLAEGHAPLMTFDRKACRLPDVVGAWQSRSA